MPSLSKHQASPLVKLLLLGDAKSGKTTLLAQLVAAGYKLRILDFDNLLDSFAAQVQAQAPALIDNVDVRTLRDSRKMTDAGPILTTVKAFAQGIKMTDRWKYAEGDEQIDLGVPSTWGPDCILVIDSLSRFCDAAYDWAESITASGKGGDKDGRAIYGNAQDAVEHVLAAITSDSYETNVIVICHGQYMDLPDGTTKIFPQGVGQKLSPKIPQYFPCYIRLKNQGGKRTIQIQSDALIDLANPKPAKLTGQTLDADTGLAKFFAAMQEPPQVKTKPQLKRA